MSSFQTKKLSKAFSREPGNDDWAPHPGPQTEFLRSNAFEVLYGGAAGGGKSDALLVDAISFVGKGYGSKYKAILFRRTFGELERYLLLRSHELYPLLGGKWRPSEFCWIFPQGERVYFGHIEHEQDVTKYQGDAFQRIAFDELTTFTEYQYTYLFSRCRSAYGVPCGIRAATNPGGIGHNWVKKRFFWWVSKSCPSAQKKAPSERAWFLGDKMVTRGTSGALSRTFIPAKLEDNPTLARNDPSYKSRLLVLSKLEQARLIRGDWDEVPGKKEFWDRERVRVVPFARDCIVRGRAWDFGASKKGDFTVGAKCSVNEDGLFVIEHIVRFQGEPDVVMRNFRDVCFEDVRRDPRCVFSVPQDPGAAGKFVVSDIQADFPGLSIYALRPDRDKVTRFRPISARSLAGNVGVVDDGSYDLSALHAELEGFPEFENDDQADAISDAYALLTRPSKTGYESYY